MKGKFYLALLSLLVVGIIGAVIYPPTRGILVELGKDADYTVGIVLSLLCMAVLLLYKVAKR